ncbi:carboxypeptidase-like regulatory domain-containing protein [Acidicapsa acidisoli]|uniref:carboxypeptidase-like regulatory domain-containing protein n=1 Tax=Acidicapsa acidisoli TaxID=1615681 RepID=UPI0021E09C90|nr:carboxypeptidase-like regulatory domain-containing protein [Acidicapsa acidisoli]
MTNMSFGQDTNASLSGTVTDPSNAAIPGAKLTITNQATGFEANGEADAQGEYTFRNLTPGTYNLSISAPNFESTLQKGIELALNQVARVDVHLTVGKSDQTITVTSDASLINYENPTLEGGVSPETLKDMPLTISGMPRSSIGLALLMPGVSTGSSGNAYEARVNGGMVTGDEALLDGATMTEGFMNQSGMVSLYEDFQMSPDMVSEVHVLTANYEAQYGATTSGQLIVQSKGGGEQFHGAAFEYLRNDKLNATQYGATVVDGHVVKPKDKENNYGANIGGPVYLPWLHGANSSRKAYFYFNWEAYQDHGAPVVTPLSIASLNARQGNFSNYKDSSGNLIPLYYPVVMDRTNPLYNYSGQQISQNIIDPSIWSQIEDPIAKAWVAAMPTPTNNNELNNYLPSNGGQGSLTNAENVYMTREDFSFRDSDHFYFTYWRQYSQPNLNTSLPKALSTAQPASPENAPVSRLNWEHTFSPVLTNHFTFGYLNRNEGYYALNAGSNLPTVAGVANGDLPEFTFSQYSQLGDNYGASGNSRTERPTWALNDVVTYVRGKHTFTFGYEWRNAGGNIRNATNQGGTFGFSQSTTGIAGTNSGDDMLAFMLGATSSASVEFVNVKSTYPRQFGSAAHISDAWRATPRLTFSYGIRWDYIAPSEDKNNHFSFFDPNGANPDACNTVNGSTTCLPGRLAFAGNGYGSASFGARYPENLDLYNFSPRVGFSYSLDQAGKTVVRAGYGIYYGQAFYPGWGGGMSLDGFNTDAQVSQIGVGTSAGTTAQQPQMYLSHTGFTPFVPASTSNISSGADNGISPLYRPEDANRRPYSSQWNLTVERELPNNFFVSASYVGTKGTHLPSDKSPINVIDPFTGTFNTLASTPVIGANGTQVLDTVLKANYNATVAANGYDGPTVFAQNGISQQPYAGWAGQLLNCTPTLAQALLPYPQYCGNLQGENEGHGNSIYNSFQGRVERRFRDHFYVLGSLTLSKMYTDATDTTQSGNDGSGGDKMFSPFNIKPLRALAEDNTPITGSLAFVYAFPFGRGERFLNSGPLTSVASGWRIAPITRYEYGMPFSFHSNSCNVVSQTRQGCLPGILPGQQVLIHGRNGFDPTKNGGQYINPNAFEPETNFSKFGYTGYGSGVTTIYGPNFRDTDWSLTKDTKLGEKIAFKLTANFFNGFNNHYFVNQGNNTGASYAFNTTVGDAQFGQWNGSVSTPRTIQFAGRLEF